MNSSSEHRVASSEHEAKAGLRWVGTLPLILRDFILTPVGVATRYPLLATCYFSC
jgi:hypothetical protein